MDKNRNDAGSGSTFPLDIIVNPQTPDVVLINGDKKEMIILELTCPWDSNVEGQHAVDSI